MRGNPYIFICIIALILSFKIVKNDEEKIVLEPKKILQERGYFRESKNFDRYGISKKMEITSVLTYYDVNVSYDSKRRILVPKDIMMNEEDFLITALIKSCDTVWLRHIKEIKWTFIAVYF